MKYLLMTCIVATLLVVPACDRRDHKDDPTYYSADQQAPPSPVAVTDNPTVLADQARIAAQYAAAKAGGAATKPASQPAPVAPAAPAAPAGSFIGVGAETKPETPATETPKEPTPEPAKEPASEPAKESLESGPTDGASSETPAPDSGATTE